MCACQQMVACRYTAAAHTATHARACALAGRYNSLQEQYQALCGTVQEQKQLIAQLEDDLHSVNALSTMFRPDADGEAGPPSHNSAAELVADAVKDVSSSGGQTCECCAHVRARWVRCGVVGIGRRCRQRDPYIT